jgi:hypothetical protein
MDHDLFSTSRWRAGNGLCSEAPSDAYEVAILGGAFSSMVKTLQHNEERQLNVSLGGE